jgi:dihydroorotate dehydrogenase electron transfer subunit
MFATVPIVENESMTRCVYRVRLLAPKMAAAICPGQFLMIRIPGTTDPLLPRPFALYDTVIDAAGNPHAIDVVYLVMGKFTRRLATMITGNAVEVWGPLGNGFPDLLGIQNVALVAGGIGQTPFLAYARQLLGDRGYGGKLARRATRNVTLFYGVRSSELVAGVNDFRAAGVTVHLASDDGSVGYRGFVTQLLARHPMPDHLIGCGPEAMLRALAKLAQSRHVPCHLSMECPMACGLGICFTCVAPIRTSGGWDYRRVCVDGPIFNATELAWGDDVA